MYLSTISKYFTECFSPLIKFIVDQEFIFCGTEKIILLS